MSDAAASLKAVVADLTEEGDELYSVLRDMDTGYWTQTSTFKNWTLWDVIAHLHFSDHLALTSLSSEAEFRDLVSNMRGVSMRAYTEQWLGEHLNGPDLLARWRETYLSLCDALNSADPDERFAWFGPGMKARMFATARQMETWAHGFEVYDLMGLTRQHTDRIKNIATIGVRTYGWTFSNRKLPVPQPTPQVALTSPSGERWCWNEDVTEHRIEGDAVAFCQVVTQVRNIADTDLTVVGDNAQAWMAIAQCFAGPPEEPPTPGSRVQSH